MKFFITGATGFIGRHLINYLINNGHSVVALLRNPQKVSVLPKKNIEFIKGDLASFANPNLILPQVDQVIHLAGTITAKKQSDYATDNFDAVKNLHTCLTRQNWQPQRMIFASSLAASGPSSTDRPLTEDDQAQPIDAYGTAKHNAENFLLAQNNYPVSIIRPPMVIGPQDTNILNLYKIAKSGFGFVPAGKNQKLSFIAVSDLVNAISCLALDQDFSHRIYFTAHDDVVDVPGLWNAVEKTLNKKIRLMSVPMPLLYIAMKLNTVYANIFGKPNIFDKKYWHQLKADAWTCSSARLKKDFGWQAKKTLQEVFDETAKSYREAGWI